MAPRLVHPSRRAAAYNGTVPDFDFFWVIILAGALISMGVRFGKRVQARSFRDSWVEAAERLGFAMTGTGYQGLAMSGSKGPLRVNIHVYRSSGKNAATNTRYEIGLPMLGLGLRLSSATGWQGLLKAFGAQDVEIGDPAFDARFVVKAGNPDRARRYFTPQRVAALNELFAQHPGFLVTDDELLLHTPGIASDVDEIVSTVERLLTTARALVMDPAESDKVLLGDWLSAAPADDARTDRVGDDVDELAANIAVGDADDSAREQELQRVFDTIEEYAEEESTTEPAEEGDVAAASASADRDALLVASRLFGDSQLSFQTKERFNEEFAGRYVEWSGTVKRPAGLMATRAFDDDREVLVLEVASLEDQLYGTTAIDAIVSFPTGAAPELGDTVRFKGHLIDVDGVSKDLYVADGELR
jgi:hypothetical protein